MREREVVIGHRLGLHARAAARLVQLSATFQSTIVLCRSEAATRVEADSRSILSILLLSAGYGSTVSVTATGIDEDQAIESICEYLEKPGARSQEPEVGTGPFVWKKQE